MSVECCGKNRRGCYCPECGSHLIEAESLFEDNRLKSLRKYLGSKTHIEGKIGIYSKCWLKTLSDFEVDSKRQGCPNYRGAATEHLWKLHEYLEYSEDVTGEIRFTRWKELMLDIALAAHEKYKSGATYGYTRVSAWDD